MTNEELILQKIDNLQSDLNEIQTDLSEVHTQIVSLDKKIDNEIAKVKIIFEYEVSKKLDVLIDAFESQREKYDEHEIRISSLERKVGIYN